MKRRSPQGILRRGIVGTCGVTICALWTEGEYAWRVAAATLREPPTWANE